MNWVLLALLFVNNNIMDVTPTQNHLSAFAVIDSMVCIMTIRQSHAFYMIFLPFAICPDLLRRISHADSYLFKRYFPIYWAASVICESAYSHYCRSHQLPPWDFPCLTRYTYQVKAYIQNGAGFSYRMELKRPLSQLQLIQRLRWYSTTWCLIHSGTWGVTLDWSRL